MGIAYKNRYTLEKSEKYLIELSRKGNSKAQRQLYELHRSQWFILCLRYGGNSTDAQDILQNGLIRVFTALKQFDENKGNFVVWSNKIMVNEALRFLQKQKRINFFEPVDESHLQIGVESNIYSLLSAKELVQLIQKLPDGYRTVFNLYTIEGYSHKEISQELSISAGTSKSQLSKAKKLLRQWIEVLL